MVFSPCNETEKKYVVQVFPDTYFREVNAKARDIFNDWSKSKIPRFDAKVAEKAREVLSCYPDFSQQQAYRIAYQELWSDELYEKTLEYARDLRDKDPRYEYVRDKLGEEELSFKSTVSTAKVRIDTSLQRVANARFNQSSVDRAIAAFRNIFSSS